MNSGTKMGKAFAYPYQLFRVMKIAFFLTFITITGLYAKSFSQQVTLHGKKQQLHVLVKNIEQQTNYHFIYDKRDIEGIDIDQVALDGAPLTKALDQLLTPAGLGYKIVDQYILLKPLVDQEGTVSQLQDRKIEGQVLNRAGEPLRGAVVTLKGTNRSTATGNDGRFALQVPASGGQLQIRFMGYETQEVALSATSMYRLTLKELVDALDEVVVVGYGTQKKADLTGAVVSLKKEDLTQHADASIGQMLSGKAPGVTIRNTNALPGGGVEILVRGAASTGAGNDPLVVIDGFPVSGGALEPSNGTNDYYQGDRSPLNSLNPDDIASIDIMKDASATAIYGARAANGVIIITTKRGKQGVQLNYSTQYSNQQMRKPFQMLDATQFMHETNKVIRERWLRQYGIAPYGNVDSTTVTPWIPRYTEAQIAGVGSGTDWWNLATQTGNIQSHNLSLSGGNETVKTFTSLGYFGQNGVLKKSKFERFTGKFNLDYKVTDFLNVGLSALATQINNSNVQIGEGQWQGSGMIMSALMFDPTLPVKDAEGNYSIANYYANMPNPVSFTEVDDHTKQQRFLSNVFAEVMPLKHLKIRTSVGIDHQQSERKAYYPKTFLFGQLRNGQATINASGKDDYLFDLTATYNLIHDQHQATFMGGYAYQQFNDDYRGITASDFFTDAFSYDNLGAGSDRPLVGSSRGRSVLGSYFARINYSFDRRYLLTLNARYDGSDKFGANNKWGFFPSAALGWRLSEESFLKDVRQLSNLKLRVSYGQTGNSNIGSNAFAFYDVNRTAIFNNEIALGATPSQLANPDLKWETTTEANIGVDFGFFNNRITGTAEFYDKTIADLLGYRDLRSWMLLPSVAANLGKTKSTGVEIGITSVNIDNRNKELHWSTTVNYTSYNDRWKDRSPDVVLSPWQRADDPIRVVFNYVTDGIVQPGEVVPHMPTAVPGNIKIKDINGFDENLNYTGGPDGKIDQADLVYMGRTDPAFTLGISNTLKYKRLDLTVYGYGMFNRWVYNQSLLKYVGWSDKLWEHGTNLRVEAIDRWSSLNTDGKYPSDAPNTTIGADAWVWEKASFFRIKNITVGYDLSNKFLKRTFKTFRVYLDVQNPVVFTSWSGMDPETDGGSIAPYPNQVSYSLGLHLSL